MVGNVDKWSMVKMVELGEKGEHDGKSEHDGRR